MSSRPETASDVPAPDVRSLPRRIRLAVGGVRFLALVLIQTGLLGWLALTLLMVVLEGFDDGYRFHPLFPWAPEAARERLDEIPFHWLSDLLGLGARTLPIAVLGALLWRLAGADPPSTHRRVLAIVLLGFGACYLAAGLGFGAWKAGFEYRVSTNYWATRALHEGLAWTPDHVRAYGRSRALEGATFGLPFLLPGVLLIAGSRRTRRRAASGVASPAAAPQRPGPA